MDYRKGMMIRIRHELDKNDPFGVTDSMIDLRGRAATISLVDRNEHGRYVRLDVDRENHYWSYDMIDPLIINKGREEG